MYGQLPFPPKLDVLVGNINPGTVSADFMTSMVALLDHDRRFRGRVLDFVTKTCGPFISPFRNKLVEDFLQTSATWLLQIDSDMVFPPDAVDTLLSAAENPERPLPILGAVCATSQGLPNAYVWSDPVAANRRLVTFQPAKGSPAIVQCEATGAAFLFVHRRVFESLRRLESAPYWFGEFLDGPNLYGEDLGFCMRARHCGHPIHVMRGVGVGHIKARVLPEPTW